MPVRQMGRVRRCVQRDRAMPVREFRVYSGGFTYAVCPGCGRTMEREYMRYCCLCGQKLDWRGYSELFPRDRA